MVGNCMKSKKVIMTCSNCNDISIIAPNKPSSGICSSCGAAAWSSIFPTKVGFQVVPNPVGGIAMIHLPDSSIKNPFKK